MENSWTAKMVCDREFCSVVPCVHHGKDELIQCINVIKKILDVEEARRMVHDRNEGQGFVRGGGVNT